MSPIADNNSSRETSQADPSALHPIRDVADITGISAYTLRYYDKCGFFPGLKRDKNNTRWFSEADIDQLRLVDALRKSGLSIEGIQYYVRLMVKGKESVDERREILEQRSVVLQYQHDEIEQQMKILNECRMGLE